MFWLHDISHYLIDLDIFYPLPATPNSVHCKHPDHFRDFNKHLIVELGMCENTYIGVRSFSRISSWIQLAAHTPCCSSGSFYPKAVEITCPKRNANKQVHIDFVLSLQSRFYTSGTDFCLLCEHFLFFPCRYVGFALHLL